eukprot:3281698-Pleurochrysis_carterae.AAC.1
MRSRTDVSHCSAARAAARAASDGVKYSNVSSESSPARSPSISYGASGLVCVSCAVRSPSWPRTRISPPPPSAASAESAFIASSASRAPLPSSFRLTLSCSRRACTTSCRRSPAPSSPPRAPSPPSAPALRLVGDRRGALSTTLSASACALPSAPEGSRTDCTSAGIRTNVSSCEMVDGFHST